MMTMRQHTKTIGALFGILTVLPWYGFLIPPVHAQVTAPLHIVSRAEWGADESYRFRSEENISSAGCLTKGYLTKEIWPAEYIPVQKFIIHHTVTNTDPNIDYAAAVRGIYFGHAVGLGWGDIGYNFLIDPNGVVYEGRYGGDGVVGGHVYNDQKHINYNCGSIGIALIGDFHPRKENNFQADMPTAAAMESLAELIAEKSQLHGIQPTGSGTFIDVNIPNIVGHRDVDATACPGGNLYAALDAIRTDAQVRLAALPPLPPATFTATVSLTSQSDVVVQSGTAATVTATVTNTGTAQWQSYIGSRRVAIIPVSTSDATNLYDVSWKAQQEIGDGGLANMAPGAASQASFTIRAPANTQLVNALFALRGPDGNEIPNTRFGITVHVTDIEYNANLTVTKLSPAAFLGANKTVVISAQNIGTKAWLQNDVRLRVYGANDTPSAFRAKSWTDGTGNFSLDQQSVAPGQTGTFTFTITAPQSPGLYAHRFLVARTDNGPIASNMLTGESRADSKWQAVKTTAKIPIALKRGWSRTVTVEFTNTGAVSWTRAMRLSVTGQVGSKSSVFRAASWKAPNGNVAPKQAKIKPGEVATYTFVLHAPARPSTYRVSMQLSLTDNKKALVVGGSAVTSIRVD